MKEGIQFLRPRTRRVNSKLIKELESIVNSGLPKGFENLISYWETGESSFTIDRIDFEGFKLPLYGIENVNEDPKIRINYFFEHNRLIEEWRECFEQKYWKRYKLMPIGINELPVGRVYLSFDSEEYGCIRIDGINPIDPFDTIKVAKEIWGFIEDFREGNYQRNINLSNIYKNWGEDFWRMRKDFERNA